MKNIPSTIILITGAWLPLLLNVAACHAEDQILPYGMVVQLRNDANLPQTGLLKNANPNLSSDQNQMFGIPRILGGDFGEAAGHGFTWTMLETDSGFDLRTLPPHILFALRHSLNQKDFSHPADFVPDGSRYGQIDWSFINVNSANPIKASSAPPGLRPVTGGDLGAPKGEGFYWFETTGENFNGAWPIAAKLPRGTVVGLKHSSKGMQTQGLKITWLSQGAEREFDPAKDAPPEGFVRMFGGDLRAPGGQGYCWYEKVAGSPPALPAFTDAIVHGRINGNQVFWGVDLVNRGSGSMHVPFVVEFQIALPQSRGFLNAFAITPSQITTPGTMVSVPADGKINTGFFEGTFKVTIVVDPEHRISQEKDKAHVAAGQTTVRFNDVPVVPQ